MWARDPITDVEKKNNNSFMWKIWSKSKPNYYECHAYASDMMLEFSEQPEQTHMPFKSDLDALFSLDQLDTPRRKVF